MDGFNPFAELQQPQGLGGALMGAPAAAQAPTPAAAPAADPAMQQRVEGWRSALQELSANPIAGIMLLQMGTALSSGRRFPEALQMGLGAAGRAGGIQNQYAQQQLKNQIAERGAGLAERKFGLDERELAAREKVWEAQTANYQRMARGGGGGGGGGVAITPEIEAEIEALVKAGYPREVAMEAVLKKNFKYGAGKYGMAGTGQTPAFREELAKRRKELEELGALYGLDKDQQAELAGIRQQLDIGGWQPTQAQPQMPGPGGAQEMKPANAGATGPFDRVFAQYATMAEAEAAASAGKIPKGSLVMVAGKRFKWE